MKLRDSPYPLRPRRQKRRSKMQRPFLLPETGSGDDAHAGGVQEAESVEFVWVAGFFFGLLDGFLGDGDCGEEVH